LMFRTVSFEGVLIGALFVCCCCAAVRARGDDGAGRAAAAAGAVACVHNRHDSRLASAARSASRLRRPLFDVFPPIFFFPPHFCCVTRHN
jgi:hypothetical protein